MNPTSGKFSVPAIMAAALAAIGASICCVVPLMLVLLGISGAWVANLTALDPYRLWFTAATSLSLTAAYWSLYGPASCCRTDGACVDERILARRRRLLWIATAVIALLLLFPYYVTWFF